ncbi:MAG: hypothetical protein K9J17_14355 [Flavobacteriales bacterium]|nr:hypothetical protein [Flavobacteriales bacterium]
MEVIPGKIYVFRLANQGFKVLWFWRDDSDDEQFFLKLLESNVRYSAVGYVTDFIDLLPMYGTLQETEAQLKKAMANAKAKGWSIKEEAFDSGYN